MTKYMLLFQCGMVMQLVMQRISLCHGVLALHLTLLTKYTLPYNTTLTDLNHMLPPSP